MNIERVTVIGANGILGTRVSAIFASFGNAKVNMVSRSKAKSEDAIKKASASVKAKSIEKNMIAKDYKEIVQAIRESDLVIETIIEDYEEKEKIHRIINENISKNAISSSVTSGISINKLAKCYNEENKKRFVGIHFFNPPYNLTLCELIPNKDLDKKVQTELEQYLTEVLIRKVIITKDKPAFLANRIGFQFINNAMQYAEKYKQEGGIDYIDAIIGKYTGRNMPPLKTADFVGLDVHKAIVDNIYKNTDDFKHETFKMPGYVENLINQGRLGEKTREGLYKEDKVYDIETDTYRNIREYRIPYVDEVIEQFKIGRYKKGLEIILNDQSKEAKICKELLINYVIYSISITGEIAYNINDCDIAMAEGFNWIPPYALADLIGKEKIAQLLGKRQNEIARGILEKDIKSEYGYEKFLKAIK